MLGPTEPDLLGVVVDRAELGPVPVRLLEVEAEDLLVLTDPVTRLAFEPVCEALVQLGPQLLRHRAVGGIADQDVAEAEGVVVREFGTPGPDQFLADEGQEVRGNARTRLLARELGDGAAVKESSLDR